MKTYSQFISEAKEPKPDALETIERNAERQTPGLKLRLQSTGLGGLKDPKSHIRIDDVNVPTHLRGGNKYKGRGVGSSIVDRVGKFADKTGKNVSLTPVPTDPKFKGPKYLNKLKKFYGRFGFRKRRKTDKILGADTMVRSPRPKP